MRIRGRSARPLLWLRPRSSPTDEEAAGTSSSHSGGKRPCEDERMSTVTKLRRREIGDRSSLSLGIASNAPERFRNILLQEEYDTHDQSMDLLFELQFLRMRSKVIEITGTADLVFVLTQSGLCAAFSRITNRRICFLDTRHDQVIRSIFYDKYNNSLITISVHAADNFSTLRCRTTPLNCIRRNQLEAGIPLFETESLKCPGFVEFDDANGKILINDADHRIYKVYEMKNYSLLYTIPHRNIQDVKISLGILLIIQKRTSHTNALKMKILSIEDGKELKSFSHMLHPEKSVDFIELFNEKLLVKQKDENLQILDVRNMELIDSSCNTFLTPSAFVFLHGDQLFLTLRGTKIESCNFRGEIVADFEDHELMLPNCGSNIYISSDQRMVISYCKAKDGEDHREVGSINMSSTHNGRSIAKVCLNDPKLQIRPQSSGDANHSSIMSTVKEALEDVTAIYYDTDHNVLYTGNGRGLIHVWHS